MIVHQKEMKILGRSVPLEVHRHQRVRRVLLTVSQTKGKVRLSLPSRIPIQTGLAFLQERKPWVAQQIASWPEPMPIAQGSWIPYDGKQMRIIWDPDMKRLVRVEEGRILVGGPESEFPNRLMRFLKERARRDLEARARKLAALAGQDFDALSVRDTYSRWGSCSSNKRLSFSWRLILAPSWVRHYVVAHEVAHLAHMSHNRRFWNLVHKISGPYVDDAEDWLRRYGHSLHWVGRN